MLIALLHFGQWGRTKNNKHKTHKHFSYSPCGTIVPKTSRPREKRDKMAILLWSSPEQGRFVPGTGPGLSQGRVPFVPGTVSCLSRTLSRPKCLCLLAFSCLSQMSLHLARLRGGFGSVVKEKNAMTPHVQISLYLLSFLSHAAVPSFLSQDSETADVLKASKPRNDQNRSKSIASKWTRRVWVTNCC